MQYEYIHNIVGDEYYGDDDDDDDLPELGAWAAPGRAAQENGSSSVFSNPQQSRLRSCKLYNKLKFIHNTW